MPLSLETYTTLGCMYPKLFYRGGSLLEILNYLPTEVIFLEHECDLLFEYIHEVVTNRYISQLNT